MKQEYYWYQIGKQIQLNIQFIQQKNVTNPIKHKVAIICKVYIICIQYMMLLTPSFKDVQ